jgi:DNA-binding transcriptional MerR regulator
MFRIGEFSRFSRVSVKMLRHYDALGLLTPAHVDPFTNYRYYTADQLPRLQRIVALKDLGFGLEQIGVILDGELSVAQMRNMLRLHRADLAQQLAETAARITQTEARLRQLEQAQAAPKYDVVLREVAAQQVAGIRQAVAVDGESIPAMFEELEAYVARYEARAPLPPLMLYHDVEFPEEAEDVEVMVPVHKAPPANERVTVRELPGHEQMACLVHSGGYDGLPQAFAVLLQWIEANDYAVVGPTREVYVRFGADQEGYSLPESYLAESDADFVTELQIPVDRRRSTE